MKSAVYPTRRLVLLAAVGAPLAFVVGVAAPGLWLLPLGWLAFILALAAIDLLGMPAGQPQVTLTLPGVVNVGESFEAGLSLAADPRRVEAALTFDARVVTEGAGRLRLGPATRLSLQALRRGVATVTRIETRWTGLFGLLWRQVRREAAGEVMVLPDIRPVRRDSVRLTARDARAGLLAQLERGQGSEFEALSTFQPGMERRRIDWKRSARHMSLVAKEYHVERDNQILLALDAGRLMCEPVAGVPRIDRAISAALLTGYVALKLGDRVGMFAFDARPRVFAKPASGPNVFAQLQRLAAGVDYATEETNFTLALSTLAARLDRRSMIVAFTDFVDVTGAELMLRALAPLLRRHLLVFVVLRDAELDGLADTAPAALSDVTRAVVAGDLLRERRLVLARLRRMGVEIVEAHHDEVGVALAQRYLDIKHRRLL